MKTLTQSLKENLNQEYGFENTDLKKLERGTKGMRISEDIIPGIISVLEYEAVAYIEDNDLDYMIDSSTIQNPDTSWEVLKDGTSMDVKLSFGDFLTPHYRVANLKRKKGKPHIDFVNVNHPDGIETTYINRY